MSDEPTERLELRITHALWDAVDRLAKAEGRHITSMARLLIERGLQDTARRNARLTRSAPPPFLKGLDKPRRKPRT